MTQTYGDPGWVPGFGSLASGRMIQGRNGILIRNRSGCQRPDGPGLKEFEVDTVGGCQVGRMAEWDGCLSGMAEWGGWPSGQPYILQSSVI